MSAEVVLAAAVGLLVGVVAGWWLCSRRTATTESHENILGTRLADVVDPLHETLHRLTDELHRSERSRISAHAGLAEQVTGMRRASIELGTQTQRLANALHTPHVRGRWGEMHLQRVIEAAGMSRHCDFTPQASTGSGSRPDLVVHLPGSRELVIDAKVPLHAYLEASATDDPGTHRRHLADHARALRDHIVTLSSKQYWREQGRSPELVVLFLPSDPILEAACRVDPDLVEFAFGRDVVCATPSTLLAMLRAVALSWREESMARDAEQIHRLGRELHHRLTTMTAHLDGLGKSLSRAVETFNSTVGALESRVLVTARAFEDLDAFSASTADGPTAPRRVDATVRESGGRTGTV